MALIQIRDVPEQTYETIRKRARKAGQSIQAYMRAQIIDIAARPTPDDLEEWIKARPRVKVDVDALLRDRDSGRP